MKARPLNPVLARELRQRMRGPRAAVVLSLYLLVLVLIVRILYSAAGNANRFQGPDIESTAALGRTVFHTLVFFVLVLVCFIVPSATAGAIAGERARQTLVPLQVTLLRSRSILFGKLMASLAFVVLLIVATLPLAGISFLLGGVELGEVVKATAMILVVAYVLAALALWSSTFLRGTQGATVVALGLTFGLCVVSFVTYGVQRSFGQNSERTSQMALVVNPFMAVADVLDARPDDFAGSFGASPFTPMQSLLRERNNPDFAFLQNDLVTDGPNAAVPAIGRRAPLLDRIPFWIESLMAWAVLSIGALALAARRLSLPRAVLP